MLMTRGNIECADRKLAFVAIASYAIASFGKERDAANMVQFELKWGSRATRLLL